ncbi:hypothetical protein BV902_18975 [Sphingobacterium sp. B29]|nr:hypothetical protein BV902_18975 [Sphingobacterium sp. B29]
MKKFKLIYLSILFCLLFFSRLYSQQKNDMAMLENKKESQYILNSLYKHKNNKTLILYNNNFYSLNNFNLIDTLAKNEKLNFKLINKSDSIKTLISKEVKSIIIVK